MLRFETVTNSPEEFRVRNRVLRRKAAPGVGAAPQGREESVPIPCRYRAAIAPIPRGLAAGQGLLSRSLDCRGRPHAGQTSSSAPDRSEEGCRGALLPGVQSDGATRRRSVQEPHGRGALLAWQQRGTPSPHDRKNSGFHDWLKCGACRLIGIVMASARVAARGLASGRMDGNRLRQIH